MYNRGPNDTGLERFVVGDATLILGHTRLSIIDLSSGGHQPMSSADGRFTVVFNGEIYNYRELRQELQLLGHAFRTESDTEVLISTWAEFGVGSLAKFRGMFSFAMFDRQTNTLTCVRDAFGIKPLFYSLNTEGLQFASDLPALLKLSGKPRLNQENACRYLVSGIYDEGGDSLFQGQQSLQPGHVIVFDLRSILTNANLGTTATSPVPERWWWPSIQERTDLSFIQAAEKLRELFLDNIRLHLRSDVLLGAALSGGLDSSAVVCAMRYLEPKTPIHTFTFVAPGSLLDETKWARLVNDHVGAIAHEVVVSAEEMVADLEDVIFWQGEPFGTTSIYAQYRLFKEVKRVGITVLLDGQGADEMMGGYEGYPHQMILDYLDQGALADLATFINHSPKRFGKSKFDFCRENISAFLPTGLKNYLLSTGYHKIGKIRPSWLENDVPFNSRRRGVKRTVSDIHSSNGRELVNVLRRELTSSRISRLLRYEDRNSMRWSIESRVPFLTTDLAEFMLSLPTNYLVSSTGETKRVFRAAMRGIVPDSILDRKDKIGFDTPQQQWIAHAWPQIKRRLDGKSVSGFLKHELALEFIERSLRSGKSQDSRVWRLINFYIWAAVFDVGA